MKSWNDASGETETVPLIAPPRRRPAGDNGGGVRIRALALTLATCMFIFGFDALFPDVKNGHPPTWRRPKGGKIQEKPFEWSQVRCNSS
jgi:hypothetical protein